MSQEIQDTKELALSYLRSMGLAIPEKFQRQFIEVASVMKLNPFLNEIHAIAYKTKNGDVFKCITGYTVYLKRAERSGKLNGWEVVSTGTGRNVVSTVTIYRKDWEKPFRHSARIAECAETDADGRFRGLWAKMPVMMCEKVAISQGFRLCFPDELAGLPYTEEELPQGERVTVPAVSGEPAQAETKPLQIGIKAEAAFPPLSFKGGDSTPQEAAEIRHLLSARTASGDAMFSTDDMKFYSEMRKSHFTARELIDELKAETARRTADMV